MYNVVRFAAVMVAGLLATAMGTSAHAGPADTTSVNGLRVTQGNYTVRDFRFEDGQVLPSLRIHYRTIGHPVRNAAGEVTNAVLIMHGTGGTGAQFLGKQFAGVLFEPGELLSARRYYIILPDDIGHGGSSKPSDGLRMKFPNYNYHDMVEAEHDLVVDGLHVNHLRLVMGTSMGCMHTWMWGEMWPNFMNALMPLACLPAHMGGRNWMWRQMLVNAIESDPAWDHGNYKKEPIVGLKNAANILMMVVADPHHWRHEYSTPAEATKFIGDVTNKIAHHVDADDMIYQFLSSRDYNPAPELNRIKAKVIAINTADDQVNPVGVDRIVMRRYMKKVKGGRYLILPVSSRTHGHGTHTMPKVWDQWLWKLLQESRPSNAGAPKSAGSSRG